MRIANFRIAIAVIAFLGVCRLWSQSSDQPAYLNPSLPAEQRAADLVHRMTVEEKVSQLVNQSRAVPRLKIPDYDWWSEALHGVQRPGATEFPEPVGLAATFDPDSVHRMATAIGIEGRIKHVQAMREGHSNVFEGPGLLGAEPQHLSRSALGTRAGDLRRRSLPVGAHGRRISSPECRETIRNTIASFQRQNISRCTADPSRPGTTADVDVSKHDELDTYLPAFRAAVTEGKAGSVMCAYNSINGQPACANEFLLQDQLRGKWNFQGYVVSDCDAVVNIYRDHHFTKTQPEASALAIQRGMDNECIDFAKVSDDHDYKAYFDAYKQGILKESEIDTALVRLFTARMKLGMFDPPEMVPYSKIDEKELDSAEHRALARTLANESMVLLKNDGTLPLKQGAIKIAVVGPLADQTKYLLGNYNGTPTHTVSVLEGLKAEFPQAQITFVPGTQFLRTDGDTVPESALTTPEGKPGLTVSSRLGAASWTRAPCWRRKQVSDVDLKTEDVPQGGRRQVSAFGRMGGLSHRHRNRRVQHRRARARATPRWSWSMASHSPWSTSTANTRRQRPGTFTWSKARKWPSESAMSLNEEGPCRGAVDLGKVRSQAQPRGDRRGQERRRCHCGPRHYQRSRRGEDAGQRGGIQGRRPHQHRSSRSRKRSCWKP